MHGTSDNPRRAYRPGRPAGGTFAEVRDKSAPAPGMSAPGLAAGGAKPAGFWRSLGKRRAL